MEETKPKKMLLTLNGSLAQMIEQIKERTGAISNPDAIRRAITAYHNDLFPAYTQRVPSQRLNRTPEEKAHDILAQKKAQEEQKRMEQLALCEQLGGEIKGNTCHYRTFSKMYGSKVHEGSATVALDLLTTEHLNKQFINTTKEECEAQGIVF